MTFDTELSFLDIQQASIPKTADIIERSYHFSSEDEHPRVGALNTSHQLTGQDHHAGDRYQWDGKDLLHSAAIHSINFHTSLTDSHRGEEYARDYFQVVEKLNEKWRQKQAVTTIPTAFPDPIRPKENLKFKKGGSRRRAYTGREATEAEEKEKRNKKRRESIDRGRVELHYRIMSQQEGIFTIPYFF